MSCIMHATIVYSLAAHMVPSDKGNSGRGEAAQEQRGEWQHGQRRKERGGLVEKKGASRGAEGVSKGT